MNFQIKVKQQGGGCIRNYRGGVLFSVLGLLVLISFVLQLFLDRYWTQVIFTDRSYRFYEARIVKELFLSEYHNHELEDAGIRNYNLGQLKYQEKPEILEIVIVIDGKRTRFTENLKKETAE